MNPSAVKSNHYSAKLQGFFNFHSRSLQISFVSEEGLTYETSSYGELFGTLPILTSN
jgi:hypothetical protein